MNKTRSAFLLALLLIYCPGAFAATTFSVTPSSVSNTYSGSITLLVTGLASVDTVTIQKFLDANGNGVVDAEDLLVQQFNLTDGSTSVIGGVTNINVPGDTNGIGGQITASLNFQNEDFIQNIVGKFLFKLSSPSGHFAPLTNVFTVTNFPYAQKFTGSVISGGTHIPNAIVILFPPNGGDGPGNPQAAAVANSSGDYVIQVPAGNYTLLAFKNNYVADFSTSPFLALGAGKTVTANLALANTTSTIAGKVLDAANASLGLPGVFLPATTDTGLIAGGFSDSNGNFSVGVGSGTWKLGDYAPSLLVHGYVGNQHNTTFSAGATGVILSFHKASSLFYGSVTDNLGNPLSGIHVQAYDTSANLYQTDATTDANGNFAVGIVGGLGGNDPWVVRTEDGGGEKLNPYIFSQSSSERGNGANVALNQAVHQNFTAVLATNHISGRVQYNGSGVSGVQVYANAIIGRLNYAAYADTDENGNYSLNVANGLWTLNLNQDGGDGDNLDNLLGHGNYQVPIDQNVTIASNNGTANFAIQPCGGVQIATAPALPDAQAFTQYNLQLEASTCNGNLNWSLSSGGLPPGLNYDPQGQIFGTPNNSGTFNFTMHVQDDQGHTANQSFSLKVTGCNVQIITTSLPDGQAGSQYDFFLQGSSECNPNLNWFVNDFANVPSGLSLTSNGELYGYPSAAGTFNFPVRLQDGNNNSTTQSFSLIIKEGPLQVTTTFLPLGTNSTYYSQNLQASGGTPPYTWSIPAFSADPPSNLTLGANGIVSGTLAETGTFYFDVQVLDGKGNTASQLLMLNIVSPPPPPLVITNVFLPDGTVGVNYSAQLGATGGQPPYSWFLTIDSAPLPAGLSLDRSSGLISGTPTTNKVSTFKVLVENSSLLNTGPLASKVFSITINPATVTVLDSPSWSMNQFRVRLTGTANQNYTLQMSTNLGSSNWISLFVTNSATAGSFVLIDGNATNRHGFYRILTGP
jgi:hypothetical protein